MSEAPANPEEPAIDEPMPNCPNCGSENIRQINAFTNIYRCDNCLLTFDSTISFDPDWFEDEEDWVDSLWM